MYFVDLTQKILVDLLIKRTKIQFNYFTIFCFVNPFYKTAGLGCKNADLSLKQLNTLQILVEQVTKNAI